MKREIKFRAYSELTKAMHMLDPKGDFSGHDLVEEPGWRVMQFTGLRDKNGKEIYEGDVLRTVHDGDENVEEVVYGDGHGYPAFDLKGNTMECNALSLYLHDGEMEVIGNIYENPELLKP